MTNPSIEKEGALTADLARKLFSYDPTTGVFTRRESRGRNRWGARTNRYRAGTTVGTPSKFNGYLTISFGSRNYQAHRLAWLYVHGSWPRAYLDHINGDRTDNRIANLREATALQNVCNRRAQQGRRLKGITFTRGRWQAQIRRDGRNLYLGLYNTAEEAAAVYAARAKEFHGEFAHNS